MKLSLINFNPTIKIFQKIFFEGYGRTFEYDYTGDQVTDPRPMALSLGRWKSPKGNQLFAGLNLSYLSPEQISRLQQQLPSILRDRNLKRRVRKLRSIAPDIFNSAYRTYKRDEMHHIDPGVLRFMKVPEEPPPEVPPEAPEKPVARPRPSLADKIRARHEKPKEVPRKTAPIRPEKPARPTKLGAPEEGEPEPEEVEEIGPEEEEEEEAI